MARKNRSGPQSFLQGAMLLTAGVLVVKMIGALFKVPLSAVITEEGMGYFSTAYSFYNVIFSMATAGLPVAVSRMVAERDSMGAWREVREIRRAALPVFGAVGAAGMVLMIVLAPLYTRAVQNTGALPAMLVLAPSVLLCAVAAAYRGYFEGLRNMTPTTVSQVTEAAAKLIFGLSLAWLVMRADTEKWIVDGCLFGLSVFGDLPQGRGRYVLGAAAAIFGVTLGSALSALFLFVRNRHGDGITREQIAGAPEPRTRRRLIRSLLTAALPLTVGAAATSISGLIDAFFLQTRIAHILQTAPGPLLNMYAGGIPQENLAAPGTIPNYLFGCYNMALTLFMLVPSVTQAFGMSALPSVTRAYTRGGRAALKDAMETVLRMTCIFAVPAGVGLSVLAEPITRLLYGDRISVPIIAAALSVMGIAAIFAAVTTPLGSLLQAVGHMDLPVILTLCGLVFKVVLNYVLVGIPHLNILGGGLSTLVSYLFVTAAEWIALRRITGIHPNMGKTVLKPVLAAVLCGLGALSMQRVQELLGIGGRFSAAVSILYAVLIYAAALWLFGGVEAADIRRFSLKEKNIKTQEKHLKNIGG